MVQLFSDLLQGKMLQLLIDFLLLEVGRHESRPYWPRLRAGGQVIGFIELVVSCIVVVALYFR
jgi:hypothetical protein